MDQGSSQSNDLLLEDTHPERTSKKESPVYAAFSVVGVALCWAIEFSFVTQLIGGTALGLLSLLLFNAAVALCYFLVSLQRERFSSKRMFIVMSCIAGTGLLAHLSARLYAHFAATEMSALLACVSSLFAGFAMAWLTLNWITSVDTTMREKAPTFVTLAALVGAGIALILSWLQETQGFYALFVVFFASYLGLFFTKRHIPTQTTQIHVPELPVRLNRSADYMTALYGLCLGYCFAFALMQVAAFNKIFATSVIALSLAVASTTVLLLWRRWPLYLSFGSFHRIMLPLTVLLLFSTMLLDAAMVLIMAAVSLFAYWGVALGNTSWFVALARRYGYEPIRYYAAARRLPVLGATLGLIIAGLVFALTHGLECPFTPNTLWIGIDEAHNTILYVVGGLTTLLLIVNSLLPFSRGTPMDGTIIVDIESSDKDSDMREGEKEAARPKRFVQHANALALKHGLSSREQDVMHLLIRGYSADTIADFLIVSRNTVRTHRANIYHKFGVHSQQELMRLLPAPTATPPNDKE